MYFIDFLANYVCKSETQIQIESGILTEFEFKIKSKISFLKNFLKIFKGLANFSIINHQIMHKYQT